MSVTRSGPTSGSIRSSNPREGRCRILCVPVKIRTVQFDPRVGDIAGNEPRIADAIARADREGVDLIVFSELAVVGYPPRDLLFAKVLRVVRRKRLHDWRPLHNA